MMKQNFLNFLKDKTEKEAEKGKNVQFKKERFFGRRLSQTTKEDNIRNESKTKLTRNRKNSIVDVEAEAKRRWKLAKNMVLAFKLGGVDKVGKPILNSTCYSRLPERKLPARYTYKVSVLPQQEGQL